MLFFFFLFFLLFFPAGSLAVSNLVRSARLSWAPGQKSLLMFTLKTLVTIWTMRNWESSSVNTVSPIFLLLLEDASKTIGVLVDNLVVFAAQEMRWVPGSWQMTAESPEALASSALKDTKTRRRFDLRQTRLSFLVTAAGCFFLI